MSQSTNPYVGPRTFSYEQRNLFFGREREARDLLARVLSERLLLFYAQSGAGKSSLINTRLIPSLQEEKGFVVLPVARVSGELPAGVAQVDNIFAFNLMLSIVAETDPALLAGVTLSDFLARLARRPAGDGQDVARKGWVYDAAATPAPAAPNSRRYALIVDQFEEIITSHPARWQEREAFFRQLDAAMQADPNLWVVLSLREDYVAALDPYAPLVADRLRARFFMQRMAAAAALDAIRRPAELGGRPFMAGVAEKLVHDLRQVRVPGQSDTVADQYVEPVQLQVVCYQLWENLRGRPPGPITLDDLTEAGDVDQSLAAFYEQAIASVVGQSALGVSEQRLRTWFSTQLITETGTRGTVFRNEQRGETAGLPNAAVEVLSRQFLLRTELRAGGSWVELVHDRFVEPILRANRARQTPLALEAEAWLTAGRNPELLYEGQKLREALDHVEKHPEEHNEVERKFLQAGEEEQQRRNALRRRRMRSVFGILGGLIAVLALVALLLAYISATNAQEAATQAQRAAASQITAATAAMEAAIEAQRAAKFQALAASEAMNAQATAESQVQALATAQIEAEIEAKNAKSQRMTAEAFRAVAVEALATSEANLKTALAVQASELPTATAEQFVTPTRSSLPQPPSAPTATPIATGVVTPDQAVIALQTQLAQVQQTQTALASSASQANTPTATPQPTATPTPGIPRPPSAQLIFTSDRAGPANLGNLYVMNSSGGNARQLTFTSGFEPTYSRSRGWIAFSSYPSPGRTALYAMSPGSGSPFSVDEQFWDNWEPSWAPAGNRIAFTSSRENKDWEIWTMDVGGGNPVQLTSNDPGRSFSPSWSPDGRYIAFFSDRDAPGQVVEIWRMNADGTNQVRLTTGNHRGAFVPAWGLSWSADSTRIAFPSNRDGNHEIYVMDADGRNLRNLTRSTFDEGHPAWSPDGQWIAFVRALGLNQDIFTMTADGAAITNLTQSPAQDWDPAWLP
jgi:Tol biopolymer transport system component